MRAPRPPKTPIDPSRIRGWVREFAAYRHSVGEELIRDWIKQFSEQDRDTAARVLDVVDFFGSDRISTVLRNGLHSIPGWSQKKSERKGEWRFAAYAASAGESGDSMLHSFRLANGLDSKAHNKMFIHPSQIVLEKLGPDDTLVFVDDFVGTGKQVCDTWHETINELVIGIGRVFLLVVAATKEAVKKVKDETDMRLIPSHTLGPSDNLFSPQCKHFSEDEKASILEYNKLVDEKNPHGFGKCGLVVVFQHRCPNNTIPILHAATEGWSGLFPRHDE